MAHELNFTDGVADFVEVGTVRSAWHREGHLVPAGTGYRDALGKVNIDYAVEKVRTYRAAGSEFVANDGAYVTIRTDTGKELGAVGPGYTVLQNVDAFAPVEPLIDAGVLQLETAGVLRGGADAWVLGRFDIERFGPVVREVFADETVPYALFTNNHSGRRNATVAETPIRVVCANTLGIAERALDSGARSVGVRHTGDAALRMVEAAEQIFGAIVERYEVIATQYRALKATLLSEEEFRALVLDSTVPDPRDNARFNPEAMFAASVVRRAERRRAEIRRLWEAGKGHTGDHSAWEAYNAVVEAVDFNDDLWPTRGGVYRTQSLLDGTLRDIKSGALNQLVKHAATN